MIRVMCETFEWGWFVRVVMTKGLTETPIHEQRFPRHGWVDSPSEAIAECVRSVHSYLAADVPETPKHS